MTRDLISGPRAQAASVRQTAHRPWPLPPGRWLMAQTWRRLLFAHWSLPVDVVRRVIPDQLPLDSHRGRAWVGLTPFEVTALRLRRTPPAPWVSSFPECNVRTYVTVEGKPGIYFFSLDAARRLAVEAARRAYRLPYFHARMRVGTADEWIAYELARLSKDGPVAQLAMRYRPTSASFEADPGSLDHFLTERYCLYTLDAGGRVLRGEIHHRPWQLRRAEGRVVTNSMGAGLGLDLGGEPLLHFADRQDVVFWPLVAVGRDEG